MISLCIEQFSISRFYRTAVFFLAIALGLAGGATLSAQVVVTGQVVDPSGTGVPGVDIDFFDSDTGDDVIINNDGTDPGGFFSIQSPTGIFDIWFYPPQVSGLGPAYLIGVTVAGNTDLGVIQVPNGYLVHGTVENSSGTGIPDVDMEIEDLSSGIEMRFSPDQTGIDGEWSIILGEGAYDFFFDPLRVYGSAYAPGQITNVAVNSPMDLGALILQPGNVLSGYVKDTSGLPVFNADTDIRDIYTGDKLFTPDDNTDSTGFFSVVVPAGTWDVEIDPPKATKLVATLVRLVMVSGSTSIGTITVDPGFYLEGTVTDTGGSPLAGVDIDVVFGGWREILTPADGTDASGFYQVVVPPATYMVEFIPPPGSGLAEVAFTQLNVTADTILNASLPASTGSAPVNYGTGLAGTGGFVPVSGHAGGFPCIGNANFGITVTQALGKATGFLAMGFQTANFPYKGGTAYLKKQRTWSLQLGGPTGSPGGGGAIQPIAIPNNSGLLGRHVYFQFGIQDAGAVQGMALSNALEIIICQ